MKGLNCAVVATLVAFALSLVRVSTAYKYKDPYYQFGYQVHDKYSDDYHGHMEYSKDDVTFGEYKIKLPDGRVQITSYEADDHGYRPTIAYEYPHRPKKIQGVLGKDNLYLIAVLNKHNQPRWVVLSKKH